MIWRHNVLILIEVSHLFRLSASNKSLPSLFANCTKRCRESDQLNVLLRREDITCQKEHKFLDSLREECSLSPASFVCFHCSVVIGPKQL